MGIRECAFGGSVSAGCNRLTSMRNSSSPSMPCCWLVEAFVRSPQPTKTNYFVFVDSLFSSSKFRLLVSKTERCRLLSSLGQWYPPRGGCGHLVIYLKSPLCGCWQCVLSACRVWGVCVRVFLGRGQVELIPVIVTRLWWPRKSRDSILVVHDLDSKEEGGEVISFCFKRFWSLWV
jgi:hypothetical protein